MHANCTGVQRKGQTKISLNMVFAAGASARVNIKIMVLKMYVSIFYGAPVETGIKVIKFWINEHFSVHN